MLDKDQAIFQRQIEPLILSVGLIAFTMVPIILAVSFGVDDIGALAVVYLLGVFSIALVFGLRNRYAALVFLMIILPWQPLLTMPLAASLGGSGVKLFVVTKELFIMVMLAILFMRNIKKVRLGWPDIGPAVFLLVYFTFLVISPAGLSARAISFREGFMVAAFYLTGRLLLLTREDLLWFLKTLVLATVPVVLFGFLEHFAFTDDTWRSIGAIDYYNTKFGASNWKSLGVLPLNWYTIVRDTYLRRITSGIGESTSFSFFLALPILALIYMRGLMGRRMSPFPLRLVLFLLIAVAQVLSYARGGMLIVISGIMLLSMHRFPKITLFLVLPAAIAVLPALPIFEVDQGSNLYHLLQMAKGLSALVEAPLGHGLGTSGQSVMNYGISVASVNMGDSYFAGVSYQMGIVGCLGYFTFFIVLLLALFKGYRAFKGKDERLVRMMLIGFSFTLGIFGTSFLSSASVAPISSGLALMFCGALIRLYIEESTLNGAPLEADIPLSAPGGAGDS